MSEETPVQTPARRSSATPVVAVVVILLLLGAAYFLSAKNKSGSTMMAQKTSPTTAPTQAMKGDVKGASSGGTMGAGKMKPMPSPTLSEEQNTQIQNGPSTATTEKTFTIDGGNFYFTPNAITVNKGDTVTITFKNDGGFHNFYLDEFDVKSKTIKDGEEDTVTFTADKAGTFEYYCSIGQHRQMGMKGTLTVK